MRKPGTNQCPEGMNEAKIFWRSNFRSISFLWFLYYWSIITYWTRQIRRFHSLSIVAFFILNEESSRRRKEDEKKKLLYVRSNAVVFGWPMTEEKNTHTFFVCCNRFFCCCIFLSLFVSSLLHCSSLPNLRFISFPVLCCICHTVEISVCFFFFFFFGCFWYYCCCIWRYILPVSIVV